MSRFDSTEVLVRGRPAAPPLVLVLVCLLGLAAVVHSAWTFLEPPLLADPRPEVRGFVNAVRAGSVTAADRVALSAYRRRLSPRAQEALIHEVNYLLFRDGRVHRFGFDPAGRVVDLLPDASVADEPAEAERKPPTPPSVPASR